MNILILSCNMGGGHHAAAYAIAEELERRGVPHQMIDALETFFSPRVSDIVSKAYTGMVKKAPYMFDAIYHVGNAISSERHRSPVYRVTSKMCDQLLAYIREGAFDAVVTTHLFPAQALTELRRRGELSDVTTVAVATDYTCIPFWEETRCDYYTSAHGDLLEEYEKKGMDPARILPFGIPVSGHFLSHRSGEEAKNALGLPAKDPLILIMTGSMGYGHTIQLVETMLPAAEEAGCCVGVICGTNEKIQTFLKEKYKDRKALFVWGYETDIPLFMDACDVLLTKPGGLTSSEAAAHTIPLIHTNPIPGCETKNARFFADRGLSLIKTSPKEQTQAALELCGSASLKDSMREAQRHTINPYAARDLCDFLMQRTEHL